MWKIWIFISKRILIAATAAHRVDPWKQSWGCFEVRIWAISRAWWRVRACSGRTWAHTSPASLWRPWKISIWWSPFIFSSSKGQLINIQSIFSSRSESSFKKFFFPCHFPFPVTFSLISSNNLISNHTFILMSKWDYFHWFFFNL